jgi:hypothetical protein
MLVSLALSDDRKITGMWSDAAIVGEFLSRVWLMIMLVPQCEKWCSSCRSTKVPRVNPNRKRRGKRFRINKRRIKKVKRYNKKQRKRRPNAKDRSTNSNHDEGPRDELMMNI